MSKPGERVLRASEVGEYVYCARAWWLGSVEGLPSAHQAELAAGLFFHRLHGAQVRRSIVLTRLAYLLFALAMIVAVLGLL